MDSDREWLGAILDARLKPMLDEIREMHERIRRNEERLGFYEQWRQRAIGAWMLIAFVFTAAVTAVVAGWEWIKASLRG